MHFREFVGASIVVAIGLSASAARAAEPMDPKITAFFTKYCLECPGIEKPKGDLRLDRLSSDLAVDANRKRWSMVRDRVLAGEMPPKEKPRPSEKDANALSEWINGRLQSADAAQGRVVLRRLNRIEYENTVRELLGVEVDLKEMLPLDTSAHGFDNVGDALHVSSFLMERYLDAADVALNFAIANLPQPPLVKKRYSLKDE